MLFRSGVELHVQTDVPILSDSLRKGFEFQQGCERAIVFVESKKDSLGNMLSNGRDFIVRLDAIGYKLWKESAPSVVKEFLKKFGVNELRVDVTEEISENSEVKSAYVNSYRIVKIERIGADSPLRYDTSNLKNNFETYWLKVAFHGSNFKWILLGFIIVVIGIFTLFMSSMNNSKANKWFKKLQLFSSAAFSIGHGGNDAQKVMGIITVALIAGDKIESLNEMPTWVPLACYAAIA